MFALPPKLTNFTVTPRFMRARNIAPCVAIYWRPGWLTVGSQLGRAAWPIHSLPTVRFLFRGDPVPFEVQFSLLHLG